LFKNASLAGRVGGKKKKKRKENQETAAATIGPVQGSLSGVIALVGIEEGREKGERGRRRQRQTPARGGIAVFIGHKASNIEGRKKKGKGEKPELIGQRVALRQWVRGRKKGGGEGEGRHAWQTTTILCDSWLDALWALTRPVIKAEKERVEADESDCTFLRTLTLPSSPISIPSTREKGEKKGGEGKGYGFAVMCMKKRGATLVWNTGRPTQAKRRGGKKGDHHNGASRFTVWARPRRKTTSQIERGKKGKKKEKKRKKGSYCGGATIFGHQDIIRKSAFLFWQE